MPSTSAPSGSSPPILALLGRRNPAFGLAFSGLILTNALVHFSPLFRGLGDAPGLVTAVAIFLPLSFWVARTCFDPGGLPYSVLASIVAAGVVLHIFLIGSMLAFTRGVIGGPLLVAIQILNPGWFVLFPWLAPRGHGRQRR